MNLKKYVKPLAQREWSPSTMNVYIQENLMIKHYLINVDSNVINAYKEIYFVNHALKTIFWKRDYALNNVQKELSQKINFVWNVIKIAPNIKMKVNACSAKRNIWIILWSRFYQIVAILFLKLIVKLVKEVVGIIVKNV